MLDQLAREGLQSDRRYAETYLDSRARKGYGPVRIRQELRERGIEDSLIEASLAASAMDWAALVAAVRDRKFGGARPADFDERARQARCLQYRGFSADQIRRAYDTED